MTDDVAKGAPVQISPKKDDPRLGKVIVFEYNENKDPTKGCPVAAHIRKTNPRGDLIDFLNARGAREDHSILRRGIPYGPEVTRREWINGKSGNDLKPDKTNDLARGLLFVSYQSRLDFGFRFIQQSRQHDYPTSSDLKLTQTRRMG
jgi:deferrochelatase/peroxidase EfeB